MMKGLIFWEILICTLSLLYVTMPVRLIGRKNEVLSFVGVSVSVYVILRLLLHLTVERLCNNVDFMTDLFFIGLILWLTIFYIVYPFREHVRNRQFIVLSLSFCSVLVFVTLVTWLLVGMTSM